MNNAARMAAEMVLRGVAQTRMAFVSSYDPSTYEAKVLVQPENVETGWIPIATPWVGNGWGLFCPPTPGDQVTLVFHGNDFSCGVLTLRQYSDTYQPLSVNSGEFWLVHQSGTFIKLTNDQCMYINTTKDFDVVVGGNANATVQGNATINVHGDVNATVGGNLSGSITGTATLSAASWTGTGPVNWTDDWNITGALTVTGPITGEGGMAISGSDGGHAASITGALQLNGTLTSTGNITAGGIDLETHVHSGGDGGGNTGGPIG